MTSANNWRTFDDAQPGAPKLLFKSQITSTGYHVQLTDLCRVWAESLNKKDIIRRAWDDGCTIDPNEDDKQFGIFLDKVASALKGEEGTTTDLLPCGDDGICMKLSAALPRPFGTFFWTVSLSRQADSVLAEVLTVPLLRQASDLQSQLRQLIHELQEKDRVISKITDRLETSGNDLTTVFPGVSNIRTNKKKTQREQLARHVKGLADFDETEWRSRATGADESVLWEKANGLLQDLPEPADPDEDGALKRKWWLELTTSEGMSVEEHRCAESSPEMNGGSMPPREDSMQDDEFQRLGTPEHLKRKAPAHSGESTENHAVAYPQRTQEPLPVNDGDSTTGDEDDLDAVPKSKPARSPVKQSSSPAPAQESTGPSRKLGTLGGRGCKSPPSPAREPALEQEPHRSKSRGKLGAIGGRGKGKLPEAPSSPSAENASASAASTPRKVGIIGGKRKPSNAMPASTRSPDATPSLELVKERSRAPTKEPPPLPRETSQERADRKREQLRKELEQMAKAPAKKKRKF